MNSSHTSVPRLLTSWSNGICASIPNNPKAASCPYTHLECSSESVPPRVWSTTAGIPLPPHAIFFAQLFSESCIFQLVDSREWTALWLFQKASAVKLSDGYCIWISEQLENSSVSFFSPGVIFQPNSIVLVFRWKFHRKAVMQIDCNPSFQFGELSLILGFWDDFGANQGRLYQALLAI